VAKISKCGRTSLITIAEITPSAILQQVRTISGRIKRCLKLKRVCDGIWPNDHNHSKTDLFAWIDTIKRALPCREGEIHREALEIYDFS
jgi:hypothetical protein